jgi:aryl-alcohol dehydrogenase-like predicted oxidoreductase
MPYLDTALKTVSPLTLGTVQLGLPYGLHAGGQAPERAVAFDILRAAADCGIDTLDTARDYGVAEEVIGDCLAAGDGRTDTRIVTKFRIPSEVEGSPAEMRRLVRTSLARSLAVLRRPQVHALLFHKAMHQDLRMLLPPLTDILSELREEGLIGHAGLSAYRPADVEAVIGNPVMSCVQVPLNIFDAFLLREGWLQALAAAGTFVFARSVFLKGLLLASPDRLAPGLEDAAPHLRNLARMAGQASLTTAELAFAFVRHLEGVGSIVFGADNPGQVRENARLLDIPPLSAGLVEEAMTLFREVPEHIIAPGLWKS